MKRYTNTDNITNDLSRLGYNSSLKDFNKPLNLNHNQYSNNIYPKKISSSDLLPIQNKNPFNYSSNSNSNSFNNDFINSSIIFRQNDKVNQDHMQKTNELISSKDKTIESMNSEINKLKMSLNDIFEKDKEIQELKNQLYLVNQKLQENNSSSVKINELEQELRSTKTKLDEEYILSSEVTMARNELEKIKEENNSLRKKMLQMNQEKNMFKLKKIIVKYTKCELDKLNDILNENDITEDSFILNDINEELIKKVISFLNKK